LPDGRLLGNQKRGPKVNPRGLEQNFDCHRNYQLSGSKWMENMFGILRWKSCYIIRKYLVKKIIKTGLSLLFVRSWL
jgi:hypothetical protein